MTNNQPTSLDANIHGRLAGKTAIVTGAPRSIGREIAFALASGGANIGAYRVRVPRPVRAVGERCTCRNDGVPRISSTGRTPGSAHRYSPDRRVPGGTGLGLDQRPDDPGQQRRADLMPLHIAHELRATIEAPIHTVWKRLGALADRSWSPGLEGLASAIGVGYALDTAHATPTEK